MLVGIDIDGVMTDFEKYVKCRGSQYLNTHVINQKGSDIAEIFGVSVATEDKFWRDNIMHYVTECPPREGLVEFINALDKMDVQWTVITDRCRDLSYCRWEKETMICFVENFVNDILLKTHSTGFSGIHYTSGDKLSKCLELGVNLMIEDSIKHLMCISKHIPMACMVSAYNEDLVLDSVAMIQGFLDQNLLDYVTEVRDVTYKNKYVEYT